MGWFTNQTAGLYNWIWVAIIAVAVIIVTIIIICAVRKKGSKKSAPAEDETAKVDQPDTAPVTEDALPEQPAESPAEEGATDGTVETEPVTADEKQADAAQDGAQKEENVKDTKEPAKKEQPAAQPAPAKKEQPAAQPAPAKQEQTAAKPATKTYHISLRKSDGMWQVKAAGAEKAIKLFNTQAEAIEYCKPLAENQDANIMIHKKDGSFRKLTY